MAESREDTHAIDIPAGLQPQDHPAVSAAMQHHPLTEITQSPGHLLLLKLWQRDEDLTGCRIGALETRLDSAKREAFQLCTLFFTFHGLFLTLLFTAATANDQQQQQQQQHHPSACKNWWVPSILSLLTSLVLVCSVQVKVCTYWRVSRQLARERSDGRTLARCMQELRMKGASFDLDKEPQAAKRMKSSSVEVNWRPLGWFSQNLVTISLLCFTGLVFPACKFILCG